MSGARMMLIRDDSRWLKGRRDGWVGTDGVCVKELECVDRQELFA